jgi:hypothetical protein
VEITQSPHPRARATQGRPGSLVIVTALLMVLGLLAFAIVNVGFEATDAFADHEAASALSVMNWLVVGLKLLGVVAALVSVSNLGSSVAPSVMTVLLWGAFATLAIYSLGTVAQAVGMATGLAGSPDQIDGRGIFYLIGSVYFAVGFGVLAISYSRRHGLRKGGVLIGVLGAPALLAGLLVVMPALLTAAGLLPES